MINGVYLAYPIDQMDTPSASSVYVFQQIEKLKRDLTSSGAASWVFDPGDAFMVDGRRPSPGVAAINREAASRADAVVAFLPQGCPTVGVPMEIDRAVSAGKPVAVVSDIKSFMLEYDEAQVYRRYDWTDTDLMFITTWMNKIEVPVRDDQTPLPIQFLDDKAFMPTRTYANDAGLDLYVSQSVVITPGSFVDVPCSVAAELPDWSWALITGRSSALRKKGLLVQPGVIDPGYRGQLFSGVWNLTKEPVRVDRGERLAQMIMFVNHTKTFNPVEVKQLTESERGSNGFGSSGS